MPVAAPMRNVSPEDPVPCSVRFFAHCSQAATHYSAIAPCSSSPVRSSGQIGTFSPPSWRVITQTARAVQQATEFGLEMQRADESKPWSIVGLNLSDLLSSFAKGADKMGVPYTPIVKNPKGGESLALYFEYDRAELHPRALKQLEVISALMKADPSKKLRIAGHTDEKGEDDYNIRLSHGRAVAVKKQLAVLGVPANQVETVGMGKAQPLSPNKKSDGTDDPEGRSHNRRAEIYLDF